MDSAPYTSLDEAAVLDAGNGRDALVQHVPSVSSSPSSSLTVQPHGSVSTSSLSAWSYQLLCLYRKSVWQLRLQPFVTLAALLLPIVCVLILYIVSGSVYNSTLASPTSHDSFSNVVRPCVTQDVYGKDSTASLHCTSIVYAPTNPATDSIIARMLAGTALTLSDVAKFGSVDELELQWANNVGSFDVAIEFLNTTGIGGQNASLLSDSQYRYVLFYNTSQDNANFRALSLQFALEQAIANTIITAVVAQYPLNSSSIHHTLPTSLNSTSRSAAAEPPASLLNPSSLSYSYLPHVIPPTTSSASTAQYNDVASQYAGAGVLSIGAAVFALLVVQHVTTEKQNKLLAMMRMNGMLESAYWMSNLLLWATIALLTSLLVTSVGAACGLQVYANVSFMAHWLSLWLYLGAMTASGLFLASLFTKAAWINLLSFLFIALVVGYSVGMSIGSVALLTVSNGAPIAAFLNGLLPVFHYTKVWYQFSQQSQYQQVSNQTYINSLLVNGQPADGGRWPSDPNTRMTELQHFSFSDLTAPIMGTGSQYCNYLDYACCDYMAAYAIQYKYIQTPVCVFAPSLASNLGYLVLLTLFYTALAWYASQVGDERAGGKKAWFLFEPSYWSSSWARRRHTDELVDGDTQAIERERSRADQSIRLVKLTKDFKTTTAVKELSLQVIGKHSSSLKSQTADYELGLVVSYRASVLSHRFAPCLFGTVQMDKSEVFCLLGHNGAGQAHCSPHSTQFLSCAMPASSPPSAHCALWIVVICFQVRRLPLIFSLASTLQRLARRTCADCLSATTQPPSIR